MVMPKIKFTIITLFQEALAPYLDTSMMRKATENGIAEFNFVNLRDFGLGPHKSVDDTPYGGGDGMVLRCEPVYAAIESVKEKDPSAKVILPTPAGELWTQTRAKALAGLSDQESQQPSHFIILCPHYEGYDQRILDIVDYPICLGPYVLTGGELPALVIIDSIVRLIPGVLGGETSAEIESFSEGDNIEYPQYTKPADFRGKKVPDILLSGHHENVAKWRKSHETRLK
ncbi:tRNA (guanosine(37)-N1)-methyltransferase TrmD [Candidatus Saccharibacteria bacterium]|nr:tRNA (guanosine(37)-N1)-methyltransferase TrmD [Candidatus Saccharibacteria bacterium]